MITETSSKTSLRQSLPSTMVGSIELRPFRAEDTAEVVELMAEQFSTSEPLTNSFFKKYPEAGVNSYQLYHDYWRLYLSQPEDRHLSTVAYDHDTKEVVGCVIAQDMNYKPA